MVTVEDVARLAGVSKSTASRALRGHPALNAETITRVRAVADQLNYVPNRVASSLALQKTSTIVLFVNNLVSRQTDAFHDGIEAVCAESGYLLLLQKLGDDRERKARYIQLLREQRVDGVIVVPHIDGIYYEEIVQMQQWGITVVQVDNAVAGVECDYVGCDNRLGARLVAEHLLALRHRRFGIISAVPALSCIQERIESFQSVLAEREMPEAALRATPVCCDSMEFGRQATHSLLDLPDRPTALFSVSAPGALGALRAIRERGLRCPEDVAVVSFDDELFAPYLETALTSVHWPAFEIGQRAAQRLLLRLRGKETGPVQRTLLPPTLIHRESTLGGIAVRSASE